MASSASVSATERGQPQGTEVNAPTGGGGGGGVSGGGMCMAVSSDQSCCEFNNNIRGDLAVTCELGIRLQGMQGYGERRDEVKIPYTAGCWELHRK